MSHNLETPATDGEEKKVNLLKMFSLAELESNNKLNKLWRVL